MYSQHEGQETETSSPLCTVCVSIVRNGLMGLKVREQKELSSNFHWESGILWAILKLDSKQVAGWVGQHNRWRSWFYAPTILSHQKLCLPWPHGLFKLIINSWSTSQKHTTTSQICSKEEDLGRMTCYLQSSILLVYHWCGDCYVF
jgi:hypothetical protein